jgi:hypothetical protein
MLSLRVRAPVLKGLGYRINTIFFGPFLVGLLAAAAFALLPQAWEVYRAILEEGRVAQGAIGIVLVVLLCFQLDAWHRMLGIAYLDHKYPEHADVDFDRRIKGWNALMCRLAAALPLIGLFAGIGFANAIARRDAFQLTDLQRAIEQDTAAPAASGSILSDPTALAIAAAVIAIALGVGLVWSVQAVQQRQHDPAGFSRRMRLGLYGLVGTIAVGATVGPALPMTEPYVVMVARGIGPVGVSAILLVTLVAGLMLLSWLSSVARVPVLSTVMMAVVVWLGLQVYGAMLLESRSFEMAGAPPPTAGVAAPTRSSTPPSQIRAQTAAETTRVYDTAPLLDRFDAWLAARADRANYARYPVFVMAAQGGGIYASATTLSFLTSLQDECPAFAQHIFAISGVSGGAVGAAVLNGLLADRRQETRRDCGAPRAEAGSLGERARRIVAEDHLSPALLQVWPDIYRLLPSWLSNPVDRSAAIERSVACAFDADVGPSGVVCGSAGAGAGRLRAPFAAHFDPVGVAPALILNTTWGETGYRAAFAPFPLHAISDGTLFAFPSGAGIDDFVRFGIEMPAARSRSLVEAAFVSARFPGIVPSYQLEATGRGGDKLWNFVDGGYVDNSGATSAWEVYKALTAHVATKGLPVDVRLVLLTESATSPDIATVETGTELSDTVAPVKALLSVRGQLSNRAVRRAIDDVEPRVKGEDLAGRTDNDRVLVVHLETEFLGWKISDSKLRVIEIMLGRADLCRERVADGDERRRIVNDNSCVKKRIRRIIAP